VTRFQFVADHQHAFEVKRLCELVEIQRSSYYAWKVAAPTREARTAADAELVERIRKVHDDDKTCGAPRITAELNDGVSPDRRVNHKRVARVMREHGIAGYRHRRRVRTTIPEPSGQKVPDLLKRDFTAPAPNQRYVGDITYLPIADGTNLYLASVIDCCSRRLVGWAVADHMRVELIEDALKAAQLTRSSLAGAIFHSDHGSVRLHQQGLRQALRRPRRHPVDGRGRHERRQRARRVVQRDPQTGGTPRRSHLARRAHLPSSDVPLARPIQHPPPALLVPLPVTDHLRDRHRRYAPVSGVIPPPCPRTGGKPRCQPALAASVSSAGSSPLSREVMMRSRLPRTCSFISTTRACPAAFAVSIRVRVSRRCLWCSGRNSGVVMNSGQVRQALACGQSFCSGSPQYPLGRACLARASWSLSQTASAS
jgi:transposase InsO family protein